MSIEKILPDSRGSESLISSCSKNNTDEQFHHNSLKGNIPARSKDYGRYLAWLQIHHSKETENVHDRKIDRCARTRAYRL
jgi:hypothetical protein